MLTSLLLLFIASNAVNAFPQSQGIVCENECTHHVVVRNGQQVCERKTELTAFVDDPCPCFCGQGVTATRRQCIWYEGTSLDDCKQMSTSSRNHPCGNALLSHKKVCYNGTCLISRVEEKTTDVFEAGSNSDFYYTAVTNSNQVCNIGKLDLVDYNDRQQGKTDVYHLTMECNACMLTSTEVFDFIQVYIDGSDGWRADYITVEVNGNNGTYYNPEWLDSHNTLSYDNY